MYTKNETIYPIYIEEEMKNSYLNYAMSVIVGRALPDVRDGLKPVHRRILFAMQELHLDHSKAYKKSARIVGEVLGKFHPHGDMAVYDALTRMIQEFSLRYPLIEGQGNFGSVDGDAAAAMRYTEARLSRISDLMLNDIEKDTVDFVANFDGSLEEPWILPASLPNLLVNGSSGIAVGMATNMPPHNLGEIVDAIIATIDKPDIELKDLMKIVPGPDFPTGGMICGREPIKEAYSTGKGKLTLRAKAFIESLKGGKQAIIIKEIPYQVNKSNLIETIASLVTDKKIEGIADIRDESDKEGMRVVIDIRRDKEPQIILNQLFKHTQLEVTFGVIMLALVNSRPQILTLTKLIKLFIDHRKDIITRRTRFELDKAQKRAHILEGLKIAVSNIDKIVKLIKTSKSTDDARNNLMKKFDLSEVQAQAILEMQLQRLTALERHKIDEEYLELLKRIEMLKGILASQRKVLEMIKEDLTELKKKFADERRTQIAGKPEELEVEDLITEEDMVVTLSHAGYIKRLAVSSYRRQRRGGQGVSGIDMKEEDFVEHLFVASTHDHLLFFTDKGKAYAQRVFEIPEGSRTAKGRPIVNLLQIASGENVTAVVAVKDFSEDKFLAMATRQGSIKKIKLEQLGNTRRGGIIAMGLEEDDELIQAQLTDGTNEITLITRQGKAIRFKEKDIREMGRPAKGVRGIRLAKNDAVVSMEVAKPESTLLTVTEGGFGKRTKLAEHRIQSRGGKGIVNIKVTKKNGEVVGAKTVSDKDEVMIITQHGMIVRCFIKDIRVTGRNAQGVRIIALKSADKVSSLASVATE